MMRIVSSCVLFLALFLMETSFVSALPSPWRFFPIVFVSAVYLTQHLGSTYVLWWLGAYGLLLDVWNMGVLRGETPALLLAGLMTWVGARHLFSNRSLYGVIGCSMMSFLTWRVSTTMTLLVVNRKMIESFPWSAYGVYLLWQGILLLGLVICFFLFSRHIRRFLRPLFLLPHETL